MATIIEGKYTLREVIWITRTKYTNRFKFWRRDVVKKLIVRQIKNFTPDRKGAPLVKFQIESISYPQYRPYYKEKDKRERPIRYQRTYKHHYDVILEFDKLTIDTKNWKGRLGSGKKWIKPSQQHVKQIYRKTRENWVRQSKTKSKTIKEQKEFVKKMVEDHKKRARYLDIGDYNSKKLGINADFCFRCAHAWWLAGHLFGSTYHHELRSTLNPHNLVFLPKHMINVIDLMLKRGILKQGQ